jgi:hypothetical protein
MNLSYMPGIFVNTGKKLNKADKNSCPHSTNILVDNKQENRITVYHMAIGIIGKNKACKRGRKYRGRESHSEAVGCLGPENSKQRDALVQRPLRAEEVKTDWEEVRSEK